jgi:hypothetical protein
MNTTRSATPPVSPLGVGALLAAPALLLVSALVQPALKSDERAQLEVILAHRDRYFWFTLLLLLGTMLLVPAFHALRHATAAPSRATRVGSALAVFGALVATGDAMTQFVFLQMAAPGRDLGDMATAVQDFDEATGPAQLFLVGGLALIVGAIVLAVGLRRDGLAGRWVSILFAIGVVANMVGFIVQSVPLLVASSAVLLVAMGALGVGLWRRPVGLRPGIGGQVAFGA